eukprot:4067503-Alexandrium_andersonii.AAC.1
MRSLRKVGLPFLGPLAGCWLSSLLAPSRACCRAADHSAQKPSVSALARDLCKASARCAKVRPTCCSTVFLYLSLIHISEPTRLALI